METGRALLCSGEIQCNKMPGSLKKSNCKCFKRVSPVDINISVPQASSCKMQVRKSPCLTGHLREQSHHFGENAYV